MHPRNADSHRIQKLKHRHHSRHSSVQISRQGSMQSLASQGAPMGSELRVESSGSL